MQPVVVLFNAIHFPAHCRSVALEISRQLNTTLIALAMPYDMSGDDYPFPNDLEQTSTLLYPAATISDNDFLVQHQYRLLQNEAAAGQQACTLEQVTGLDELVRHTEAAALLVVDAAIEFPDIRLDDILVKARCPVFISAGNTQKVEQVVLAYDATDKSRYAIRQFATLLPAFTTLPTFLVSVNVRPAGHPEEEDFLNHWWPAHFPKGHCVTLQGDVGDTLAGYLQQFEGNTLVVMGAFGRGAFSRFFHPSTATVLMDKTRHALFIAHQ